MRLQVEWSAPILMRLATAQGFIYDYDFERVPRSPGVYIMGRRWGKQLEALYVGKANRLRGRVRIQRNNLRLMQHLRTAKSGRRILLVGKVVTRPGQRLETVLPLIERALIRYFLSEGHDLVNVQGTRLRRHEVVSSGRYPRRLIPDVMYLEKRRG